MKIFIALVLALALVGGLLMAGGVGLEFGVSYGLILLGAELVAAAAILRRAVKPNG